MKINFIRRFKPQDWALCVLLTISGGFLGYGVGNIVLAKLERDKFEKAVVK